MAESAGTAVPSRQVSIIVDDGRFGPGAVPTTDPAAAAAGNAAADATDGAEVLVLARVVLDPVAIAGEALAASPTAAEQPLSAGVPDFLGGACVAKGQQKSMQRLLHCMCGCYEILCGLNVYYINIVCGLCEDCVCVFCGFVFGLYVECMLCVWFVNCI